MLVHEGLAHADTCGASLLLNTSSHSLRFKVILAIIPSFPLGLTSPVQEHKACCPQIRPFRSPGAVHETQQDPLKI